MGFSCGIIGLPNVGKSTLFRALTAIEVPADNYEFCTIEPNRGKVPVPEPRLHRVAELYAPERVTPTTLEIVDVAGLVKGASQGEGLGNRFLGVIRELDAVVHLVRVFGDEGVPHRYGAPDPVRDLEVVETELILRDLETLEAARERARPRATGGDEHARRLLPVLDRAVGALERGVFLRHLELDGEEAELLGGLFPLTTRPVLVVANVDEGGSELPEALVQAARERGAPLVAVSARIEAELTELPPEERDEYREALGMEASGLERVVSAGYHLLDLVTFFTTVGTEVRAWTVPRGTAVAEAAGRIHTDMEQGFIKAEVIHWEPLVQAGSEAAARAAGQIRVEGRDYAVQDGDVVRIHFR